MRAQVYLADGNCYGKPELTYLFYSTKEIEQEEAKIICSTCPAKLRCRSQAIDNQEQGIWGGLSEDSRNSYVITLTLKELHYTSSQHNILHEQVHLESAYSSSLSYTSIQPNHILQVLDWDFASSIPFQTF